MDWNTKIEMVKALNKGNYEQAVSIFSKDKDWDYQTIDMFINGFNLSEHRLLEPIKERILNTDSEYLSLRAALRWETVREAFKGNIKFKK